MASIHRVNRVRELLLRELSDIVSRLKDPRIGMVTVVDTGISRDLRYATMYVSVLGSETQKQETLAALESARGFMRREIARRISLRFVPELRIEYDETGERAARITELLDGLHGRQHE